MSTKSPLAPETFPNLPPIAGVELRVHAAGLKYKDRPDTFVASMVPGTTVAGVFTRSACPSAAVEWCRSRVDHGRARAVMCNSGNANAFTGQAGRVSVEGQASAVASSLGIPQEEVFVTSTGVIGEPLDDEAMSRAIRAASSAKACGWHDAATAIGTTDTFAKGAMAKVGQANICGIAKGSGMIAPDMATMLSFIFTDLAVTAPAMHQALQQVTASTFNRISVDSDTSTSDTVLAFATAASPEIHRSGSSGSSGPPGPIDGRTHPRWPDFVAGLETVCLDLAHQIVRDGEGATKFVEVKVTGASSDASADVVARSIANSPLVKTAWAGEDANWGRIVMAVGKAGEPAERDKITIWIGDELVALGGQQNPEYNEARATEVLANSSFGITVDMGIGDGVATIWTCDLTHRYIEINAGYRS